jgi:hypothetical protein
MDQEKDKKSYDEYPFAETPFYDFDNDGQIDLTEEATMMGDQYVEYRTIMHPEEKKTGFHWGDFFLFQLIMRLFSPGHTSRHHSASRTKKNHSHSRRNTFHGNRAHLSTAENILVDTLCFFCLSPLALSIVHHADKRQKKQHQRTQEGGGLRTEVHTATHQAQKANGAETEPAQKQTAGGISGERTAPQGKNGTPGALEKKTASSCPAKSTMPRTSIPSKPSVQSSVKMNKPPQENPAARPVTNASGAWRLTCEDGSAFGLNPAQYATEQQYLDALETAKFAQKFRKGH